MLEVLQNNKEAIKLAELAALIHDLDKMEPEFIADYTFHSLGYLFEQDKNKDNYKKYINKAKTVPIIKQERLKKYGLENMKIELKGIDSKFVFSKILHQNLKNMNIDLLSAFIYHHDNDPQENIPLIGQLVHAGLCGADGIDSELDKNAKMIQNDTPFKIDSPFGIQDKTWSSQLEQIISEIQNNSNKNDLKELMKNSLGATQYPCNDVTLWDHSYSVASMSKSILVKILLEYASKEFSTENQYMLPLRSGKGEDNKTDFTFLKVSIDRSYLLSRGQKTGDIWGISEQVEDLQDYIKYYIENELLIGNETYVDENKQLFLIPKLGTWKQKSKNVFDDDIQEKFELEIREKITNKIEEWLIAEDCNEFPFSIEFANYANSENEKNVSKRILIRSKQLLSSQSECKQSVKCLLELKSSAHLAKCEVCGIRSGKNGICKSCETRRSDAKTDMRRNSKRTNATSNLQRLINKKVENKLVLISASFDLSKLYNGTIFDKVEISKGKTKSPSLGRLNRSYETLKEFFENFQNVEVTKIAKKGYYPITTSPQRMEFVVAGKVADEVISKLYEEYQKNFGKFRDVLPINIGAIFFYSKFPLYAVLEAEQNMRISFKTKSRKWDSENKIFDSAKFAKIGDSASYAKWNIDTKLSDGRDDTFHKLDFNTTMQEGCLDFVLIDSAAKRHKFTNKGLEHHICGVRKSYPTSVISDFERIWSLVDGLEKNQISIIENLICERIQSWGDKFTNQDEVFKKFCDSVIMSPNAFGKKVKENNNSSEKDYYKYLKERVDSSNSEDSNKNLIVRAATNGLLLDVIDLFIHLENKKS